MAFGEWLFGEQLSDPQSDYGKEPNFAFVFHGSMVSFSLHTNIEKVMLFISTVFKFNSETHTMS